MAEMGGLEVGWKDVEGRGRDDWEEVARGNVTDVDEDCVKVLFLLHLCPL